MVGQSSFSKGHNPSPLKGFRADPERTPSGFVVGVEKGISSPKSCSCVRIEQGAEGGQSLGEFQGRKSPTNEESPRAVSSQFIRMIEVVDIERIDEELFVSNSKIMSFRHPLLHLLFWTETLPERGSLVRGIFLRVMILRVTPRGSHPMDALKLLSQLRKRD